jgi:hypothetical protein
MAEINFLESVPYLLSAPSKQIWTDYDDEADVLYISFRKPQQANDSVLEGDTIYHYHEEELVAKNLFKNRTFDSEIYFYTTIVEIP